MFPDPRPSARRIFGLSLGYFEVARLLEFRDLKDMGVEVPKLWINSGGGGCGRAILLMSSSTVVVLPAFHPRIEFNDKLGDIHNEKSKAAVMILYLQIFFWNNHLFIIWGLWKIS